MSDYNDKPSYEEWLRQKENDSPYKDLEDAVKKTVDSMYDGLKPEDFDPFRR